MACEALFQVFRHLEGRTMRESEVRVTLVRQGRAWCPECGFIGTLVRHPDTLIVPCPKCGSVCQVDCSGDEA